MFTESENIKSNEELESNEDLGGATTTSTGRTWH